MVSVTLIMRDRLCWLLLLALFVVSVGVGIWTVVTKVSSAD